MPGIFRRTCSVQALSFPLLQERRTFFNADAAQAAAGSATRGIHRASSE